MDYLGYWLVFVACLRLFSVVLGYLGPKYFRERLFVRATTEVSALQARTFSVWTLLTCSLCLICAFHPYDRAIHLATCFSFYAAFTWFALEYFKYRTVSTKTAAPVFVIATVSAIWMTVTVPL